MALHTLGTVGATSLNCLPAWSAVLAEADVAAIAQSIVGDGGFGSLLSGFSAGETYVLATATTHTTNSLTAVAAATGSPPVTQIHVGDLVLGISIPPGTFVQAFSGTTATLSQAATASATGVDIAFVRAAPRNGIDATAQLYVPRRGTLRVLPGDVVAIDNTGWPILVSANTIAYAGSEWTFT